MSQSFTSATARAASDSGGSSTVEQLDANRRRAVRPDDYYFTREDLATALRMHPDTLKRRRQLGEILVPDINEVDSLDRPHRVLWRRDRVEAWIRDGAPKDVVRWDREYRRTAGTA